MSDERRPKILQAGEGMRLNVQGVLFRYKATMGCTLSPL
jgi:hypothetical protein